MSSEELTEEEREASEGEESVDSSEVRERLGAGRERAVEGFDEGVIDLLSWVLDTETRAKIYIHLRKHPDSTSDEVAEGTGLYPSTVREALAELHEEGTLERGKRESGGAGNNPYEYRAIPPSALVRGAIGEVQDSLNAVFQLDRYVGGEEASDAEPVTITVEDAEGRDDEAKTGEASAEGDEGEATEDGATEDGATGEEAAEDWSEAHEGGAMADETDAEPDASALSKTGDGGDSEADEDAPATEDDDVDHSDAAVDEDLADQDEEAVEEGEAAEAKVEDGTEGESQEADDDGDVGEDDQDEEIEESL